MSASANVASPRPRRVLLVAASPGVSTTVGGPVGFWASELIHAWAEFVEAGYEVTIASPKGGRIELDSLSDPRDPSHYSAHDLLSLGFLTSPEHAAMLDTTRAIAEARVADYETIVVAGGQSPMFTFPTATGLHRLLGEFYSAGKVTAALCHGVCALLYVTLPEGPLVKGHTITGFSNAEEDIADAIVGQKVMPFRIEDEARKLGANFVSAGPWREFAIRDGGLVTGQQQYSGRATARLVIEAVGR